MEQQAFKLESHTDYLKIPQSEDSIADVARKLTALANAVRRGQSIAAATNYVASMTQKREPLDKAVTEMTPQEHYAWSLFASGKYPLPEIDWDSCRDPAPTSPRPLRIAQRRAEALNRLYNTEKAEPSHSVWFSNHTLAHLFLVKAMARVIGAERNLLGGQDALSETQVADLQTINKVLSLSTEILKKSSSGRLISVEIASAQRILGSQRDRLKEKLAGNGRKRKGAPE